VLKVFFKIDKAMLLHHKSEVKHSMRQLYFLKEELFKSNHSLWAVLKQVNKEEANIVFKEHSIFKNAIHNVQLRT
jgi:hypothetical protein